MKRGNHRRFRFYVLAAVFLTAVQAVVIAQPSENAVPPRPDPCQHSVVVKATSEGLNALTAPEIPKFIYHSWRCKKMGKSEGRQVNFGTLYRDKRTENYDNSKEISGVGASLLTATVVVLFYSYLAFSVGAE